MDEFFSGGCWAVVGVSKDQNKYGTKVHKRLKKHGERVYAVNPRLSDLDDGEPCYADLASLPESVDQIVLVIPPKNTEEVVVQAVERGIKRVWMQPGAESRQAVAYCKENGVNVVSDKCILRYLDDLDYRV
jgi:predicted CoA-binding protein